jgi:hypothetical protein
MKKIAVLSIIGLLFIISITAFKQSGSEKKEYVTIYHNDLYKECTISSAMAHTKR